MDYLASMYIDNEMNLDEKKIFVKKVKKEESFYRQTLDLLSMEQLLRQKPIMPDSIEEKKGNLKEHFEMSYFTKMSGYISAGLAIVVLFFIPLYFSSMDETSSKRFVLYEPAATSVELIGSFTDWHGLAMKKLGKSGYWEIQLELSAGEYRYSYVLDNERYILDPTLPASESDDFGGQNSILKVGERI